MVSCAQPSGTRSVCIAHDSLRVAILDQMYIVSHVSCRYGCLQYCSVWCGCSNLETAPTHSHRGTDTSNRCSTERALMNGLILMC